MDAKQLYAHGNCSLDQLIEREADWDLLRTAEIESSRLADPDMLKDCERLCDMLLKRDSDSASEADLLSLIDPLRLRDRLALMLCDMNALRDSSRLADRERDKLWLLLCE